MLKKVMELGEMKTLYVSDLDGTLMRSSIELSKFTTDTINELISRGLDFTYATARSINSAREITGDLKIKLPVVTRNGAVLADNTTGKYIERKVFTGEQVERLKSLSSAIGKYGFVSCFVGDSMYKQCMEGEHPSEFQGYIDYYVGRGDRTLRLVSDTEELFVGEPGYLTLIASKEVLEPYYEEVRKYDDWEIVFSKDSYRDEYWLEVAPKNSTKAKSLLILKEQLGFDRLVVFGDSVNDKSMFEIADEAYAVSNAIDELKAMATDVIGCNDDDAVAKFLALVKDF